MRSVTVALVVAILAISLVAVYSSAMFFTVYYTAARSTPSNIQTSRMMSGWTNQATTYQGTSLTIQEAKEIALQYLASLNNPDLKVNEIMEFQDNFYLQFSERSTGIGAFEMLIWKQEPSYAGMGRMMSNAGPGRIVPEPGPNMMWNTKYGGMGGMMRNHWQAGATGQMLISEQDARPIAETYLSQNFPGAHVERVTRFYGYYTIDFEQNDKIIGMLSVNGYTGQVWYHSWHGAFIQEIEFD